jgi:hypothetical protein
MIKLRATALNYHADFQNKFLWKGLLPWCENFTVDNPFAQLITSISDDPFTERATALSASLKFNLLYPSSLIVSIFGIILPSYPRSIYTLGGLHLDWLHLVLP